MTKIVPVFNLIVAILGVITAIASFAGVIVSVYVLEALVFIVVLALVACTSLTSLSLLMGIMFFKDKLCRAAMFISLAGLILTVGGWIMLYAAG